jgi:hypothetical protein
VRDEELERLAVEEGRLRLLKLRKEIEAIQGPLPDDGDNDDEGEIPQIVKELAHPVIALPQRVPGGMVRVSR